VQTERPFRILTALGQAMTERHRTITCVHFRAIPGTRRCEDYVKNGSCRRSDEFMCVEWLKVNHGIEAPTRPLEPRQPDSGAHAALASSKAVGRDLFCGPVTEPVPKPKATTSPSTPVVTPSQSKPSGLELHGETPMVRAVTEADVASFKAAQIEACLENELLGPVWIVPEYTEQPRHELKIEHAMVLAAVASVFPDARLVALRRPTEQRKQKSTGT